MKTNFLFAAAFTLGLGISSADAQVRHRAQNEHQRIRQGVRSGELTRAEARNLGKDQRDIHRDIKLAKSDGKITAHERKIIAREERRESREIYRKKHNRRERH